MFLHVYCGGGLVLLWQHCSTLCRPTSCSVDNVMFSHSGHHAAGSASKAHDTHSRNRCHKSTPFFWRRFLVHVSCKSGIKFVWYQILALIRTLFYSKPKCGMRITEMITCDWLMIIVYIFMCIEYCIDTIESSYLFVYLFTYLFIY